ncbi:MAG: primosomal protein N' [Chlamydiia bacterium]|nr:primosomal protein N' [Chlamydiia bacterium]
MSNPRLFVEVVLDQSLTKPLDYEVPLAWQQDAQIGVRVEVPLKTSVKKGTITQVKSHTQWPTVKSILRLLSSEKELSDSQWKLAQWMSHYYATPLQKVLKCFIPPHIRKEVQPKKQLWVTLLKSKEVALSYIEKNRNTPQATVLEQLLATTRGIFFAELHVSKATLKPLLQDKWIAIESILTTEEFLLEEEFFPTQAKNFNPEQQSCFDAIAASLEKQCYETHLIQGITGSGKTEIYLQAIQKTLDLGRNAILLVPEISLTSQTIERFRSRFSEKIAILHHRRTLGERTHAWEELRSGKIRIAIGARSAVFCPIQKLGLIIVDEEHDGSYKQSEECPCYSARDVAIKRAHIEQAVALLGSATPAIESRYNADIGKYRLHKLQLRANAATLPTVQIVDMKQARQIAQGFTHFSPQLLDKIEQRLAQGEQTLLFLNKRGYHRQQVCAQCRAISKCPHCDLALTFHRQEHHLRCHLCDYQSPVHRTCPSCGAVESLSFKGFGTEHVERSLHAIFPDIRTLRMDRDTTRKKNSHEDLFKQFRSHKADVLIGTQMIAKGFHFPAVTLVGVLNPDSALMIPDFRSTEWAFQILTQVAGRAGRSQLPGEVIFQTFLPEHPVLHFAASQNYEAFYEAALAERKQFLYPPFCHLVKLVFSHTDPQKAEEQAHAVFHILSQCSEIQALPVTTSGHPKISNQYYYQFIIKAKKVLSINNPLNNIQSKFKIDIDPLSTFY